MRNFFFKSLLPFVIFTVWTLYLGIPLAQAQSKFHKKDSVIWRINAFSGIKNEFFTLIDPMNALSIAYGLSSVSVGVLVEKKISPRFTLNTGIRRSTVTPYEFTNSFLFRELTLLDRVAYAQVPLGGSFRVFRLKRLQFSVIGNVNTSFSWRKVSIVNEGVLNPRAIFEERIYYTNEVTINPFINLSAEYGWELSRSLGKHLDINFRFARDHGFWSVMKSNYTFYDHDQVNLEKDALLQSYGSGRYFLLGLRYYIN